MTKGKGPLVILSGPSGAGKSTVVKRLLALREYPLRLSVSATTRDRREGEQDGVDYFFWTREQFEEALKKDAFLEWAKVHGRYYGTLKSEVDAYRQQGIGVLLDIDTQGAAQVRARCPDAVSIFLLAPSMEEYERRLRERGTEDEAAIRRRVAAAQGELVHASEYQHRVVNDRLDAAVNEVHAIIKCLFERESHAG